MKEYIAASSSQRSQPDETEENDFREAPVLPMEN
jgi:hypothetical protein